MKRNLTRLSENVFDVLIIGGGVYGLFTAWDAALRGLSVALLDKGDFGNATSYNSSRMIHGGLRYLLRGNVRRAHALAKEQTTLMRIAPHLVSPLPILVPIYDQTAVSSRLVSLVLALNNIISPERSRQGESIIPRHRMLSKDEVIRMFPEAAVKGLSGGLVFYDAQLLSSERLIVSVLRSASAAGVLASNYVQVTDFVRQKRRIIGVKAKDLLSGEQFEIGARLVINAVGPWTSSLLKLLGESSPLAEGELSKSFNVVVSRR